MPRPSALFPSATPRIFLFSLALVAHAACPDQSFAALGRDGYRVGKVSLIGPFGFLLPDLRGSLPRAGEPVRAAEVESGKAALRDRLLRWPNVFDSPAAINAIAVFAGECREEQGRRYVDVSYRYFTTRIPAPTFSSRYLELVPALDYNRAEQTMGGGRLNVRLPRVFDRFAIEGAASQHAAHASAYLEGASRLLDWRVTYAYRDRPTNRGRLSDARLSAQLIRTGRQNSHGLAYRYGSLVEGGSQRSDIADSMLLRGSRFGSWKSFAGIGFDAGPHSLKFSYGLQLSHIPDETFLTYTKQLIDTAWDLRTRRLEIETRLQAGFLDRRGPTPVAERFIGGALETQFIPGDAWSIRANPVVRGIPGFWLNRGPNGSFGSDRFAAVNWTASAPIWRVPLVPREVNADPEIRGAIEGQLQSAQQLIEVLEKTKDAAHRALFGTRAQVQATLEALQTKAAALHLEACADQADTLAAQLADLRPTQYWGPFVEEPSDPDDVTLVSLQRVCFPNAGLLTLQHEVAAIERNVVAQLHKIDGARAAAAATRQMQFPRRAVRVITEEMNAFSLSPLVLFDAARLSPSNYYSAGGGVRLTIASSVSFTVAYAANLRRGPGDRPGGLILSLGYSSLFGNRK